MTEPTPDFHVPEQRTLLKATAIAAGVAALLLFLVVLPAEYAIDPTGFGEAIGINGLSAGSGNVHAVEDLPYRTDSVNITIPAGEGVEYKFGLREGSGFVYHWTATAPMFFDFHGSPSENVTRSGASYEVGDRDRADGSFQAPFEGKHGWWWFNDTDQPQTVTLQASGHYHWMGYV